MIQNRKYVQLLALLKPFKPFLDSNYSINCDVCSVSALQLACLGIKESDLESLPKGIYDGPDKRLDIVNDDVLASEQHHVFHKSALEAYLGITQQRAKGLFDDTALER